MSTRDLRLLALNAQSGALYPDFGQNGVVDLSDTLGRVIDRSRIRHVSPVAVVRDTIIVGSSVTDRTTSREAPPGHVRGYDARTGAMKWIFHTIPEGDEFGVDSWQNGSWRYTGHTNVWGNVAADEQLSYVYLPTSTPTLVWRNASREQPVRREPRLCRRRDRPAYLVLSGSAPRTVGLRLSDGGQPARDHRQWTRDQGDRADEQAGIHICLRPCHRRTGLAGNVPGEWYSPTQPFPTKPAPFDRQGITIEDLIDFTPALREEAVRIAARGEFSLLFTPPTVRGVGKPLIQSPGPGGGANWPGAAVDPESGRLFVPSQTRLRAIELVEYRPPVTVGYFTDPWAVPVSGPRGLPLVKPPYKRVTPIDLNTGDHAWMTPHGDGPRDHPALRELNLPALGGHAGVHGGAHW